MGPYYAQIAMRATVVARGGEVKNFVNVFNYKRTSGVAPRVKSELDTQFQSVVGDTVILALNVDYTQVENTVRWLDDATDSPLAFPHANVGAITGQRYNDFTAAYIIMRTAVRKTRGSKHFGPLAESTVNGDAIETADFALFTSIATALEGNLTDASGNVWQPTIVNTKNGIFGVNPTLFGDSLVTACQARKTVGTMRRRKVRGVY